MQNAYVHTFLKNSYVTLCTPCLYTIMYHISETCRCWTKEAGGKGTHFCCDSCVYHVGLHNSVYHVRHRLVFQVTEPFPKKRLAQTAEVSKKAVCTHFVFVHNFVGRVCTRIVFLQNCVGRVCTHISFINHRPPPGRHENVVRPRSKTMMKRRRYVHTSFLYTMLLVRFVHASCLYTNVYVLFVHTSFPYPQTTPPKSRKIRRGKAEIEDDDEEKAVCTHFVFVHNVVGQVCTRIVFVHKCVRHVCTHFLSVPTDHPGEEPEDSRW